MMKEKMHLIRGKTCLIFSRVIIMGILFILVCFFAKIGYHILM